MQEFKQENFNKSLNKAKGIMENSINKSHGTKHAEAVEFHALSIFEEVKTSGNLYRSITKEMVILVSWWHDVYISKYSQLNWKARRQEDVKSADLFLEYNSKLFPEKELKQIAYSISVHSHPISYFLQDINNYTQLTQILIEADCIEGMDIERTKDAYSKYPKFLYTLGQKIYKKWLFKYIKALPQSNYAKKMYKLKRSEY